MRAGDLELKAASLNKEAADLRAALDAERAKTSARPWGKAQFDAIQAIKDVVTDVGIIWQQHCLECESLAMNIEFALSAAGAKIYVSPSIAIDVNPGITVLLPKGQSPSNHPLSNALANANNGGILTKRHSDTSDFRTDIPVILVGEKPISLLEMPYSPPAGALSQRFPLLKSGAQ